MRRAWRRVFHRYWWTLGWENTHQPERSHLTWRLCPSSFNRPILRWDREHRWPRWAVLEWSNGNSDPAISIGYQLRDR